MNRKSGHETVLYYNPEFSSRVMKLKGVLVRMGIRIRNVAPEQVLESVGALAGISGYARAEQSAMQETAPDAAQNDALIESGAKGTAGQKIQPEETEQDVSALPVISEEMLVMHGFTSRRIDELLAGFRKAGVPKVELKAIVTETNAGWTFYHLYEEIKEEHERMKQMEKEQGKA